MAKKHVFLSYCHEDFQEVSRLRYELIEAGEQVWWDDEILPGRDWKLVIEEAMEESYAVVLCFSKEAEAPTKSGMFAEALDAIGAYRVYAPGTIFLIPVRLSECRIPPFELDATRRLDRLQYVDLFPPSQRAEGLRRLVEALRAAAEHP